MRTDVLLYLAAKLDELQARLDAMPKETFKADEGIGLYSPFWMQEWAIETECGFAGCMVGWAAHEKWLDQFGYELRLVKDESLDFLPTVGRDNPRRIPGFVAHFARFLGVRTLTVEYIIMPSEYVVQPGQNIEPRDVAERIRDLVKHGEDNFLVV